MVACDSQIGTVSSCLAMRRSRGDSSAVVFVAAATVLLAALLSMVLREHNAAARSRPLRGRCPRL